MKTNSRKKTDPPSHGPPPETGEARTGLRKAEWVVAVLLTVVVLSLLTVRAFHAGGLWRDECAVVQLARMPTFTDIFHNFQHEAFPLFFFAIIRGYSNVFGTSDTAFRVFGLSVGALIIAALWFNAWQLGRAPPLLALVLLGLNSSVLTFATSVRGYGLGMLFVLLVFGLTARALVQPTRLRLAFAFLASLASVHCLLYNSFLLAGIAGGAIVVALFRRNLKLAGGFIALGALCALSVLPYIGPYSSGRDWNIMLKLPIGFFWLWQRLTEALGAPWLVLGWVWQILLLAVAAAAVARLWKRRTDKPAPHWDWQFLGVFSLAVSAAFYFTFLKLLGYQTYAWYYLALMALMAAAIELLVQSLIGFPRVRIARLGFAIVALLILPFAVWPKITVRQTNTDLVARVLEDQAKPGDLIVLTPWFHGISFNWYYRGAAPWLTLPVVHEHRTHRYDLLKEKMMAANPIEDVRDAVTNTLQSGGRVWMVGHVYAAGPGEIVPLLPPAPHSPFGWSEVEYEASWVQQIVLHLQQHARHWGTVRFKTPRRISDLENVTLFMAEGWK